MAAMIKQWHQQGNGNDSNRTAGVRAAAVRTAAVVAIDNRVITESTSTRTA